MQGRNGEADVENGLVDTVGQGKSRRNRESSINVYTLSGLKWIAGEKLLCTTMNPIWCSVMTSRVGKGERREGKEGVDVCTLRLIFIAVWQKPSNYKK